MATLESLTSIKPVEALVLSLFALILAVIAVNAIRRGRRGKGVRASSEDHRIVGPMVNSATRIGPPTYDPSSPMPTENHGSPLASISISRSLLD